MTTAPAFRLPPGPRAPRAVQGAAFAIANRHIMFALHRRYGETFTTYMPGFGHAVVVTDPALVKQVFTADPKVLHVGDRGPLGKVLGPASLFSLDEEPHLRERRMLLPPFHGARMKSYEAIFAQEARKEIAGWPQGVPFATLDAMMRITLNAILRTVFGAEHAEFDGLRRLLPGMVKRGSRLVLLQPLQRDLGPLSPGGKFLAQRREFDGYVAGLIAKAKADPDLAERDDILAMLVQARYEDGDELSQDAISDQLLTLLVAGHETTAGSLAWTIERLRRHPEVLARLVDEVHEGGRDLREATIRETQRTRPVIGGTVRFVMEPFALGEWLLPPGMAIIVSAALTHADDRYYENAAAFDPDRFLGVKPDTYTWTPYGGGVRRCIGAAFAHMEMDVVLRTVLEEVELLPTADRPERTVFRGVAFAPAKGGRAIVRHRTTPLSAESGAVPATVAA
ncbi:cytochrome P450 [Paraconexibacter sp.]|uniref:cytochrome P450 n=1 Tax=Paraconexibacter sp. TaxID=2949640 RepID=UPI003564B280